MAWPVMNFMVILFWCPGKNTNITSKNAFVIGEGFSNFCLKYGLMFIGFSLLLIFFPTTTFVLPKSSTVLQSIYHQVNRQFSITVLLTMWYKYAKKIFPKLQSNSEATVVVNFFTFLFHPPQISRNKNLLRKRSFKLQLVVVKGAANDARNLEFDSRTVTSTQCRQRLAVAAMLLQSCAAQMLSRGDRSHHSLHASVQYREYNGSLILIKTGENFVPEQYPCYKKLIYYQIIV